MILTVTLNPSVDHAIFLDRLKLHDTNRVKRMETDAGGKGVNVARVAAELGAETLATGFLGGGNGAYIRKVLDKQGVRHDFIEVGGETRTNFSVEDDSGEPATTFNEPGQTMSEGNVRALFDKCLMLAKGGKWAALGGSLPPGVKEDIFADLTRLFHESGVKVALDADGEALRRGLQAGVDFVKPNVKEAERLLKTTIDSREDAISAARAIRSGLPEQAIVVISMGEGGAVMSSAEGLFFAESPKVEARSTIGSGDSLIGAMLWALEQGKAIEEALRWGISAGAATATTDGSEIARKPVVLELLPRVKVQAYS